MARRANFMFYPIVGVPEMAKTNRIRVLAAATKIRRPDFQTYPL